MGATGQAIGLLCIPSKPEAVCVAWPLHQPGLT